LRRKRLSAATHAQAKATPNKDKYTDRGQAYFEEIYRQRVLLNLKRRAQQIGMMVVPDAPAAAAA